MSRRVLAAGAGALVLVAVAAAVVVLLRDGGPDSRLAEAVALAPEGTQRFVWTDWAGLREELGSDVSASSSPEELAAFLDEGNREDLTTSSAIGSTAVGSSAETLHTRYGVSPALLEWELVAQGEEGAVIVMKLPEEYDVARLEGTLEELGYQRPDEADGVWVGGFDLIAGIGTLTPEMANFVVDQERRLLVAGDREDYLADWSERLRGEAEDGVTDVVAEVGDALAGSIYTGEHACGALAMNQAPAADRTRAANLLAEAGEVDPVAGFAIVELPGGDVRVAMAFESEEQARTNADVRAVLAGGPAPGQGGDFTDRYRLRQVAADDRVVTMELEPVRGAPVVSDLSAGPVLFATC